VMAFRGGARPAITPGRGASVPRSNRRYRPQARRFNPAGFSFGFGGFGKLLLLLRMALGRRWRSQPTKSCGPPLFEPSLKVQWYTAHSRNSGFAVLPLCVMTSTLTASERSRGESAAGARALAPIGRYMRGPNYRL
jgi:hypothetical protein